MADKPGDATLPRVGIRAFREQLAAYLRQAQEGRSFLVMSHDEVLAEIRPPAAGTRPARRPGALRGTIRMSPDFDTPPADVVAAMEGEA